MISTGLLDGMSIDQIGKHFSSPDPNQNRALWISAAFGVASILDPMYGSLSSASVMSHVAGGDISGFKVDITSARNGLTNIIHGVGNEVVNILKIATGNGKNSDPPAELTASAQKDFPSTRPSPLRTGVFFMMKVRTSPASLPHSTIPWVSWVL